MEGSTGDSLTSPGGTVGSLEILAKDLGRRQGSGEGGLCREVQQERKPKPQGTQ